MSDSLRLERDGYRAELNVDGLRLSAIGRNYDQRDDRSREQVLYIPTEDLAAVGSLLDEISDVWSALVARAALEVAGG